MTFDPEVKVTAFFEVENLKNGASERQVTIAQVEKYLTYGMVLCLVTLTDLLCASHGFVSIK